MAIKRIRFGLKFMKRSFLQLLAVVFVTCLLSACNLNPEKPETDPIDLKPPVINMIAPEMLPPGSYTNIGPLDSIPVEIEISDNYGLARYIITIVYMPELYYLKAAADPMEKTVIQNVTGKSLTITPSIMSDWDPAAGPYEFRIKVIDVSGLESEAVTYLMVSNGDDPIVPTVTISSPTVPVDTFNIGRDIPVSVDVSDNEEMADVFIRVRNIYTKELLEGSEMWFDPVPAGGFTLDTNIYIPPTVPGDYRVEVYGRDTTQNLGYNSVDIYISTN